MLMSFDLVYQEWLHGHYLLSEMFLVQLWLGRKSVALGLPGERIICSFTEKCFKGLC
jgi:hypothetical protein